MSADEIRLRCVSSSPPPAASACGRSRPCGRPGPAAAALLDCWSAHGSDGRIYPNLYSRTQARHQQRITRALDSKAANGSTATDDLTDDPEPWTVEGNSCQFNMNFHTAVSRDSNQPHFLTFSLTVAPEDSAAAVTGAFCGWLEQLSGPIQKLLEVQIICGI